LGGIFKPNNGLAGAQIEPLCEMFQRHGRVPSAAAIGGLDHYHNIQIHRSKDMDQGGV
jgi:hypothetical protein